VEKKTMSNIEKNLEDGKETLTISAYPK